MSENKLLNGNVNEIFEDLFVKYSMYIEYQNRLKEKFGIFWCSECKDIHDISMKVKGQNLCRIGYNKSKGKLMKQYRARKRVKKEQTLTK